MFPIKNRPSFQCKNALPGRAIFTFSIGEAFVKTRQKLKPVSAAAHLFVVNDFVKTCVRITFEPSVLDDYE